MRRPASAGSSARSRDCAPLCAIERRRGRRAETVHFAVLEQVISTRADTERPSAPPADDPEVLDADALLGRVNGNQAAVAETIAIFRAGSGEMLRAIDGGAIGLGRGGARARRAPAERGAHGAGGARGLSRGPSARGHRAGARPPLGCRCAGRVGSHAGTARAAAGRPRTWRAGGRQAQPRARAADRRLTAAEPPARSLGPGATGVVPSGSEAGEEGARSPTRAYGGLTGVPGGCAPARTTRTNFASTASGTMSLPARSWL